MEVREGPTITKWVHIDNQVLVFIQLFLGGGWILHIHFSGCSNSMLYHCDIRQVAELILVPRSNYTCLKEKVGLRLEHVYLVVVHSYT